MSKLSVTVDRILSITGARGRFNGLVEEVAGEAEGMYVLTKGGAPVVAVVNVVYLERLMEAADNKKVAASPLPAQEISHAAPLDEFGSSRHMPGSAVESSKPSVTEDSQAGDVSGNLTVVGDLDAEG